MIFCEYASPMPGSALADPWRRVDVELIGAAALDAGAMSTAAQPEGRAGNPDPARPEREQNTAPQLLPSTSFQILFIPSS